MKKFKAKKSIIFLSIILLFINFLFAPVTSSAEILEDDNNGNSLNKADSELEKTGDQIREEIELDTEELETHGLKEIGNKKGDFYKAYKEEFDEIEENVPGGATYVKLMKKYNYHDGEFECGKFDIVCHVVNFGFVMGSSIVNALLAPLEKLAIEPEKILADSTLTTFKSAFFTFTTSLLAVFILFQVMKIYAFRMTNHSDTISLLNEKVVKIVMAAILLFSYDVFFKIILNIQYRVTYGLFNYLTNTNEVAQNVMLSQLLTPNGIVFVLMVLVFAILLAVLFFQMLYSFAMIGVFYIVGPVAVTTMVNDDYNMFPLWLKTIISRFLTLALQGLCVVLCLSFGSRIGFLTEGSGDMMGFLDKITAIVFLVVGIAIPGLLKEFGNSSGAGRATTGGARTAASMMFRK